VTLARKQRLAAHAFTLGALALWLVYSRIVPPYQMPGPLPVALGMASFFADHLALGQLLLSLGHVAAAIAVSFLLGVGIALLAHYVPVLRLLVYGRLTPFLNSFSGIGWTLLAVLWFGLNDVTVIFAVSAVLLPFALVNMREGLQSLDGELLEMAQSFGRSHWRGFRKIVLPSLAPFMFATLRVSFGVSWKVTLTAELFGGNGGLGYLINVARQEINTALIFAAIALIVLFVHATDRYLLTPLQNHVLDRYRAL
jgi:NitT/TauT family transport system permease protein/sulfonate transport system permease protein